MKQCTLLIPAYNEEKNIVDVISGIQGMATTLADRGWQARILVVDDGSQDRTAEKVREMGEHVVQLPVNLGYGAALQTGFRMADHFLFDALICMDADGQHRPQDVLALLEEHDQSHCDVILGSRFVQDTGYKTNWSRKLGIQMFSWVLCFFSGKRIYDVTTGFQLLSKPVVKLFAEEYPSDYPDAQILLLLALSGFRIKEIPVTVLQRVHGSSMHSSIASLVYPVRNLLAIIVILLRLSQIRKALSPAS